MLLLLNLKKKFHISICKSLSLFLYLSLCSISLSLSVQPIIFQCSRLFKLAFFKPTFKVCLSESTYFNFILLHSKFKLQSCIMFATAIQIQNLIWNLKRQFQLNSKCCTILHSLCIPQKKIMHSPRVVPLV